MKFSAALLCLLVAVVDQAAAGRKLPRKRAAKGVKNGDTLERLLAKATVEDNDEGALWDRILQDSTMNSVLPETPPPTKAPVTAPTTSPPTTPAPKEPTTGPPTTQAPVMDPTPPPTDPPVMDPTEPPVMDPTPPPTEPPVMDPTPPPTDPPVVDPTPPPTDPPVVITDAPTTAPVMDPTPPPTDAPTTQPVLDPTPPPTDAPTTPPVPDPTPPPTDAPTTPPVPDPTPPPTEAPTTPPVPDPTPPPTEAPTTPPVPDPTPPPTEPPTTAPVPDPTPPPTEAPTTAPVPDPTPPPTEAPTTAPVPDPTPPPTEAPTAAPIPDPTPPPTEAPTVAPVPDPTPPPTDPPVAPPSTDMRAILTPVALQGGAEFDNPENYQAKALAWLESNAFSQDLSNDKIIQRYALACIYYATFGVQTIYTVVTPRGWIDSTNWVGEGDECSGWYGITCNANGQVERIVLASNRLTGSFPAETSLMASSVTRIDLFRNSVYNSGDAGNSWLGQMTNLRELFYGQTNFEYNGIPPQIASLTNLVEYDCSFTLYFGPLQGATFSPLQNLEYLVLSGNSYNNSIPVEIGNLPNLQFLYVQNAFVDGDLSFMQPMKAIVECWVDQNPGLGGQIPAFMGTLQTLQSWSITRCGFTGQIPTELGNLRNMVRMWLYDNLLTGPVPTELGNLFKLQTLELEENLLTGTMPEDICLNRAPLGLLTTLEADCSGNPPEIECTCCTCCESCLPSLGRSDSALQHTDPTEVP